MADTFPGGRDFISEAFKKHLVPSAAIPTLLASLSDATIKQYSTALRSGWSFCKSNQVPLFEPTVQQTLEFLAQKLPDISSFSSLNTLRSAISLVSHNEIGNHPIIRRFCKGVAALKPPHPRYDFIWDPAPVIAKLATIYPYDSIPLKIITWKLVLLLALGTGHRAQTLNFVKLSHISLGDKTLIRIPDRLKTSAPGRPQPLFYFSRFSDCENLCIVRLLERYIHVTRDLRPPSCDRLFISYSKPFKPVSAQSISRWIKLGLGYCGIDTSIFSAHSTRHASTSLAAQKGITSDLIKRAAGWSGESRVFAAFYNRPIINQEDFTKAVLLS
ncbi:hypothetical protein ALC57_02692 [Trachymyrmex cornetzi]|uniref:Tyr recombinase domain-containing protein n=1 Tax=Trachymyrmex cornetzi TaxID=471704 RepID=A0A151JN38_9HYME|nr:hypothetical protein ALC57_02692 [Trachymyrmex cornetzi]